MQTYGFVSGEAYMRKVLGVVGAMLLFAGPAFAADLAVKAPPLLAPAPSWTGFYFGGNLGWAWSSSKWCTDATIANCTTAPVDLVDQKGNNFLGGGQIGWRWQFNNFVLGVEGMYDGMNLSATSPGIVPGLPGRTRSTTFNNLYSATGQLGFAWNQALIYGKGGWAGTEVEFDANNTLPGGFNLIATKRANGWTAGGGVEYMLSPYISAAIEYDYYRFDNIGNILNVRNSGGVVIPCSFCGINTNVQTVTGRINFKLDSLGWFR
jgi:outer membrane immunogenic protein